MHLNSETSRYVFRIIAVKEILENPKQYGFIYREKDLYVMPKYKTIEIDSTISDLADFATANGTNYKLLKQLNPWLRQESLPDKSRRKYNLKIPNDNNKNSENQEKSEQSKQENQSTEKEEDKTQQQSAQGDKGQEKEKSEKNQGEKNKEQEKMAQEQGKEEQEGKGIPEPQKSEEDGDNQDRMNAQAILDALKEEEKIHQKRQIARAKSKKLEKDW